MLSAVFLIACFPALLCQSLNTHVYVYDGEGTDELHVSILVEQLKELLDPSYNVDTIGPNDVKDGTWATDAALFVMPGGFDNGFIRALGDVGAEQIKKYVREGGSYLGEGAGSYYACESIEFDKGGKDEVVGPRPLKFFPGVCKGPVYGPYDYEDYSGARAAPIYFRFISPTTGHQLESINMKAYYNGGNNFSMANVTTCVAIASFSEKNNDPAVVKCTHFGGVAVLAGIHLEFGSTHLDSTNAFLLLVQQELQPYNPSRIRAFDSILQHLGLTTRPVPVF